MACRCVYVELWLMWCHIAAGAHVRDIHSARPLHNIALYTSQAAGTSNAWQYVDFSLYLWYTYTCTALWWRYGSGLHQCSVVALRRAWLVLGWVTAVGETISACNQSTTWVGAASTGESWAYHMIHLLSISQCQLVSVWELASELSVGAQCQCALARSDQLALWTMSMVSGWTVKLLWN